MDYGFREARSLTALAGSRGIPEPLRARVLQRTGQSRRRLR
jgi:hypothetical protein